MTQHTVRLFRENDKTVLIELWHECDLTRPWNNPHADIDFCVASPNSCLLVMENDEGRIVGSVMVGYDSHRGWFYYLAVVPKLRHRGIGRQLLKAAENWLRERGVRKAQLMIRSENQQALSFYEAADYAKEDRIIMSKWLEPYSK
jgi:ribosomal protein S18 acetylase RimI-like enzyme